MPLNRQPTLCYCGWMKAAGTEIELTCHHCTAPLSGFVLDPVGVSNVEPMPMLNLTQKRQENAIAVASMAVNRSNRQFQERQDLAALSGKPYV